MAASFFSMTNHELYLVTCRDGGTTNAMIASWVLPATLAPGYPRLVLLLSRANFSCELIRKSGRFALQMLADDQADLVAHFGLRSGRDQDKFADLPPKWRSSSVTPAGLPLVGGGCGWAECHVRDEIDSGDRYVLLADVPHQQARSGVTALRKLDLPGKLPLDRVAALLKKALADGERDAKLMRQY